MEFETDGLPKGWLYFKFGDFLILEYGKSKTKKNRLGGIVPVYGSSGIVGYHNEFLVKMPCLVIGRKGSAGHISYVDKPCWPLDTTYYIDQIPMYNIKLFFWLLQYMRLNKLDTSTAIPSLRRNDVYLLSLPLPPLPEQHRIVAKLESIFKRIDACKERLEKLQGKVKSGSASLATLKSSVLKQAFEGKLVPQDPNDEPAEKLLNKIDDKKEFETDGLPKGWIKVKINQICKTKSGGTPSRQNIDYFNGSIPWIKSGELNDSTIMCCEEKITKLGLKNSNAAIYPTNTVLMAMYGATIGKLAILNFEATTNQAICAFFHDQGILFNSYLFWFLMSIRNDLLKSSFGGAQKNLSREKIHQIQISLPPFLEQHRIVAKLESIFDKIDAHVMHVLFA